MSLKGLSCRSTAHALPRSPAKGRILARGAPAALEIDPLLTSELEAAGLGSDQ